MKDFNETDAPVEEALAEFARKLAEAQEEFVKAVPCILKDCGVARTSGPRYPPRRRLASRITAFAKIAGGFSSANEGLDMLGAISRAAPEK